MKFKILPKVSGFTDAEGNTHLPGEVLDLPPSYLGESWLEPVEKPEIKIPQAKIEKIEDKQPEQKPLPLGKPKKARSKF